jgi:predicted ArsR family transcriptional regulator
MDPVLMTGAIAASILSIVAVLRVAWRTFERAVRSILRDEIQRVHRDMDDIEVRFERLEAAVEALREAVSELRQMMFEHVADR